MGNPDLLHPISDFFPVLYIPCWGLDQVYGLGLLCNVFCNDVPAWVGVMDAL